MPYRRIDLVTPLSPEEVRQRLQRITRGPVGLREGMRRAYRVARPGDPAFVGSVSDARFELRRDIRYGNSFLPVIRGKIDRTGGGETRVRVTMTLHGVTAVFMIFWFAVVLVAVVVSIAALFAKGSLFVFAALALAAGGVAMLRIGFYGEARRAERILRNALART